VYNPLAAGLLTGKHDPNKPPTEGTRFASESLGDVYRKRYWLDSNFEAVNRIKKITQSHDRSMAQFAIAWILNNRFITSVIVGATSVRQFEENLGATEIKLSEEERDACDNVWQQLRPPRFSYGAQQVER
jgi:aryl-alcohol dehydrogenase-like predicted oxidoreductase